MGLAPVETPDRSYEWLSVEIGASVTSTWPVSRLRAGIRCRSATRRASRIYRGRSRFDVRSGKCWHCRSVQGGSRPRSGERSERSLDVPERSRTISGRSDARVASGSAPSWRWSVDTLRLNIYRDPMNVELTPDQRALIRRAIETGRFRREEEAVHEALALQEERERSRLELVAALDEAEASLARGEGQRSEATR